MVKDTLATFIIAQNSCAQCDDRFMKNEKKSTKLHIELIKKRGLGQDAKMLLVMCQKIIQQWAVQLKPTGKIILMAFIH